MIEIVIIVLITGIIAAAALPLMNSALSENKLQAAASEINAALEFAQFSAMTSGMPCRVTIDDAAETVLVEQIEYTANFLGSETQLAEADVEGNAYVAMTHPLRPGKTYSFDVGAAQRVDIVSAAFGAGNVVVFDELGAPSEGGGFTLNFGDFQGSWTVDALTGKIEQSS